MAGGGWFTTRSGILRGEAGWELIAPYADPIERFLDRRCAHLSKADREDLLQEILVSMKTNLVGQYDPSRGGFRPYLRTSITNRVRDFYRKRKVRGIVGRGDDPPDVPGRDEGDLLEEDADALDLEACLLGALHSFHDRHAREASPESLELLYVFSGALVDGLPNEAIAAREKKSKDQVKRLLQRARSEILEEFVRRGAPGIELRAPLARAADLVRRIFREPRQRDRILERDGNPALAEAVGHFLIRLEHGRARLPVLASNEGREFEEAIRAVFAEDA